MVIPEIHIQSAGKVLDDLGYKDMQKLIILNVGAAWVTKRWDPEKWVRLINLLETDRNDLFFLLLWGNEEEKKSADFIHSKASVNTVPFLSIKEVFALIKRADLLVSGDTFALQAACALSTSVVGLFGPTTPSRNGPFSPNDRVAFHEMECSHCYKRKCDTAECIDKITPEEVRDLILEILAESKNR